MNILSIDFPLHETLVQEGHHVRHVDGTRGVLDIPELLERWNFIPDLLIQSETLDERTFLRGLDSVACLKVFWAIDSHLNIHWQKYYTRLFDVVFTPHVLFYQLMPQEWTPPLLHRLAKEGTDLPFRPHGERQYDLSFVGRDNPKTRPLRHRFLNLLRPLGLVAKEGLSPGEMLALYSDTRIVPNESIAFEVNFRLMEAASAGACVLGSDIGEDQNALYEPDKEILVYSDGLDLLDKADFLRRNPKVAEQMGYAAWQRTRRCHLPVHRVQQLFHWCAEASPHKAKPIYLEMTVAQRGRATRRPPPESLLARLAQSGDGEALALVGRCRSELYPGEVTERLIRSWLVYPESDQNSELYLAGMGHALRHSDQTLFNQFWILYHIHQPGPRLSTPESLYTAALCYADLLQARQRLFQPGFPYDATAMVPETALEALLLAKTQAEGNREWAVRLEALCARFKGLLSARLSVAAALTATAHPEKSWRSRLLWGQLALQGYEVQEGHRLIRQASLEAARAGKQELFRKIVRHAGLENLLSSE